MKKIILVFMTMSFGSINAQELVVRELAHFYTQERNEKKILFSEKKKGDVIYFELKATNKNSKDFVKCKWIKSFSNDQLLYFINSLESIENESKIEASLFSINSKNNKIVVKMNDTSCSSEHKMYYFQKSCKRSLSFVFSANQSQKLIKALRAELKLLNHVSK